MLTPGVITISHLHFWPFWVILGHFRPIVSQNEMEKITILWWPLNRKVALQHKIAYVLKMLGRGVLVADAVASQTHHCCWTLSNLWGIQRARNTPENTQRPMHNHANYSSMRWRQAWHNTNRTCLKIQQVTARARAGSCLFLCSQKLLDNMEAVMISPKKGLPNTLFPHAICKKFCLPCMSHSNQPTGRRWTGFHGHHWPVCDRRINPLGGMGIT